VAISFYGLSGDSSNGIYEYRGMRSKEPTTVFGRRLREARRVAAIPQDKLGVRIGIDESVASARISRYETGENEPPFRTAVHLAGVLQVPVAYFYCDDDELAEIVLGWGLLSKTERKRVKPMITARLGAKDAG
jgi:transcriptional regulator with XRE-family HTH domain